MMTGLGLSGALDPAAVTTITLQHENVVRRAVTQRARVGSPEAGLVCYANLSAPLVMMLLLDA